MKVILISGKSQSGKDQLAYFMDEKARARGLRCVIIHFADLVKYFARAHFGYTGDKTKPEERQILQTLGTDIVRNADPDYWAEVVARYLYACKDEFDIACIPDVRFPNEIDVVDRYFPTDDYLVRIVRKNPDDTDYYNPFMTPEQLHHESETALDDYYGYDDYIINRTLRDLENSAVAILDRVALM